MANVCTNCGTGIALSEDDIKRLTKNLKAKKKKSKKKK